LYFIYLSFRTDVRNLKDPSLQSGQGFLAVARNDNGMELSFEAVFALNDWIPDRVRDDVEAGIHDGLIESAITNFDILSCLSNIYDF